MHFRVKKRTKTVFFGVSRVITPSASHGSNKKKQTAPCSTVHGFGKSIIELSSQRDFKHYTNNTRGLTFEKI